TSLSAMAACRGTNSVNCKPGTFVGINLNGPRYSLPESGFGSYESKCDSPPGCQTMMTAFFSALTFTGSAALACRNLKMAGRLSAAKPARPVYRNARRPVEPKGIGPR